MQKETQLDRLSAFKLENFFKKNRGQFADSKVGEEILDVMLKVQSIKEKIY